jgi:hypothetical protein
MLRAMCLTPIGTVSISNPYAGTDLLAVLAILAGAWTIAALTATVILGIVNLVLLESYLGLHPKH